MRNVHLFKYLLESAFLGQPHNPTSVDPTYVMLTCKDNVTVDSLINITMINFSCEVFNGIDRPLTISVYKDRNLTSYTSVPVTIKNPTDDDYGTYTFVASSEYCGSDIAVSRLLQRGQFCR